MLDWGGAEAGQGTASGGRAAHGSPAAWTTDDSSNTAAYHSLNRYRAIGVASFGALGQVPLDFQQLFQLISAAHEVSNN